MEARPTVFTVKETARYLKLGERQTREALERGELPGVKIGARWRVGAEALWRHVNRIQSPRPGAHQEERPYAHPKKMRWSVA